MCLCVYPCVHVCVCVCAVSGFVISVSKQTKECSKNEVQKCVISDTIRLFLF